MKKLISILASLCLAATMVAPVFAAEIANNAPVVENTLQELSAADFEGATGVALSEGQKGYILTINASGLDLHSAATDTGFGKTKRTGVILMGVDYNLKFEDSSKIVGVLGMDDGICTSKPDSVYCNTAPSNAKAGYPQAADSDTTGTSAKELYINTYAIAVNGEVTADIAVELKITRFEGNVSKESVVYRNDNNNISYTVNGQPATSITFGATEEPPVTPEPPVDPEPPVVKDIIISDPMNLVTENGDIGTAWDVTINNFDDAVDYVAIFTDVVNNTTRDGGQVIKFEAEVKDGSIAFATILNQSQARTVSLNIEKK